jgi:hypothetical protein
MSLECTSGLVDKCDAIKILVGGIDPAHDQLNGPAREEARAARINLERRLPLGCRLVDLVPLAGEEGEVSGCRLRHCLLGSGERFCRERGD